MGLGRGFQQSRWGRIGGAALGIGLSVALAAPVQAQPLPMPPAPPTPAMPSTSTPGKLSEPNVVNYAVLGKESVGLILNTKMGWERFFTTPYIDYRVDLPACNNAAGIGLPEVYNDGGLIAFRGAETMTGEHNDAYYVKQTVGVYGTAGQADWAFKRVGDRTLGCNGVSTDVHYDNGPTKKWKFTRGPVTATDADWFLDLDGSDRRCYFETRRRENVLLQIKACQSGNAGPSVMALGNAMQSMLFQQ